MGDNFKKDIYLVQGNGRLFDNKTVASYKQINFFGHVAYFEYNNKKIGICHEPWRRTNVLEKGECDIIFYGHTHEPWEEKFMGVKSLNPGTLGGMFLNSTFAVWDMDRDEFELKRTESL